VPFPKENDTARHGRSRSLARHAQQACHPCRFIVPARHAQQHEYCEKEAEMFFPDYWSYGVMLSNQNPWGIPSGAIFITLDMDICDAVDAGNARFPTPEEKAIAKSLSVDKTAGRHWIGL
jgi:hypothetical protein